MAVFFCNSVKVNCTCLHKSLDTSKMLKFVKRQTDKVSEQQRSAA